AKRPAAECKHEAAGIAQTNDACLRGAACYGPMMFWSLAGHGDATWRARTSLPSLASMSIRDVYPASQAPATPVIAQRSACLDTRIHPERRLNGARPGSYHAF